MLHWFFFFVVSSFHVSLLSIVISKYFIVFEFGKELLFSIKVGLFLFQREELKKSTIKFMIVIKMHNGKTKRKKKKNNVENSKVTN